jgi:hypothetical protein
VGVAMLGGIMVVPIVTVAVGMKVMGTVVVAMAVDMDAIPNQAPEDPPAEQDQHDPDHRFESTAQALIEIGLEHDRRAADDEQHERMTDAPADAVANDEIAPPFPDRDGRQRRQMIGLERMAKTDHETKCHDLDQAAISFDMARTARPGVGGGHHGLGP